MTWNFRAFVFAMGLTVLSSSTASAQMVVNPSFEDLVLGDGGFGAAPGWSSFLNGAGGTFNPMDAHFPSSTGDAIPLAPPADGVNFGYFNDGGDLGGEGFIYQDLGNIPENASYVLSVAIGNRLDLVDEMFALRIVAVDANFISTTIGEFSGDAEFYAPAGTFLDAVASAPVNNAYTGQLLQIHLINTNSKAYDVETAAGLQVIFDNVRLINLNAPKESADFDGDGDVDGADFLTWQRGVGSAGGREQGNANGDEIIDGEDLGIWEDQFGDGGDALAAATTIPEPTGAVLFLLAFGGLLRGRFI